MVTHVTMLQLLHVRACDQEVLCLYIIFVKPFVCKYSYNYSCQETECKMLSLLVLLVISL